MKTLCLVACLLSILVLAACGGTAGDVEKVEEAIRASLIDPDPSACTELWTQRYLEQLAQKRGPAALEDCEEEVENPVNPTESVAISEVEIEGEGATALVAPIGGWLDGQVVELALAEEQGQWKLDQVTRFVEFDASAFARATEKTVEGRFDASPEQVECIGSELEEVSRPEAEVLALSPRVTEELADLGRVCLGGSSATGTGPRISPKGAVYSYRVPSGFGVAEPRHLQDVTAASAVGPIGGKGDGQGVIVAQVPIAAVIETPAQLRQVLPALKLGIERSAASVGAIARPPRTIAVDGHPAVQWETEGGTRGPYPGTDVRETTIYAGREAVLVACRWKGERRDAILEACDSVLRSLRLSDEGASSTSS